VSAVGGCALFVALYFAVCASLLLALMVGAARQERGTEGQEGQSGGIDEQ
jgi:hypothetical protein